MKIDKILKNYKNLKILITGTTGLKVLGKPRYFLRSGAKIYGVGLKPKRSKTF